MIFSPKNDFLAKNGQKSKKKSKIFEKNFLESIPNVSKRILERKSRKNFFSCKSTVHRT